MRFPVWKYLLILVVLTLSAIYAIPNLYPDQPALQISGTKAGVAVDSSVQALAVSELTDAGITVTDSTTSDAYTLIKVADGEQQLKGQTLLRQTLGDDYVIALNLAPTTPAWLQKFGAKPMKLGLDLRGGVQFTLEVDTKEALKQQLDVMLADVKRTLKTKDIEPLYANKEGELIKIGLPNQAMRGKVQSLLGLQHPQLEATPLAGPDHVILQLKISDAAIAQHKQQIVEQNLVTMRTRINELGVAEALAQRQGDNRIVIELPGVQDTAEAKRVLGSTANLEFRMVHEADGLYSPDNLPLGAEAFGFGTPDGQPMLLERQVIARGEHIQNASDSLDENQQAQVNISLDSKGGRLMASATRTKVGKQMAVLFVEHKQRTSYSIDPVTGKNIETRTPFTQKYIINRATVQDVLGSQFRINGLDSLAEAKELALLLRAGSLAAPMYFVEERTIGPSLGKENISKGVFSTKLGFLLVGLFMLVMYKAFGLIANIALLFNLAMIAAAMSLIGAALSLPGIAGIVLTIGMAVDANVLIFERIKDELRIGSSSKQAIVAGFDRAYTTILDANLTTLIVALILFAVGTGPIKGFAITLSIGILCSMFTAITVTRALVELSYGRKANAKLSI